MIEDESIDFIFSFDSLVHVEKDVIKSYLQQIALKLKPNGVGFIHHSNLGNYLNPATGKLEVENIHWRAESMTAKLFEQYSQEAGLQCFHQEIVNWCGDILCDCFSLITLKTLNGVNPIM